MNSLIRLPNRRLGYASAAFALVIATVIAPLASAAQVTERSIALSSSSADADDVTYNIKFTATQSAGAFVVDFCTNTPLVGEECDAPAGMAVAGATASAASTTGGVTAVGQTDDTTGNNTVRVTKPIAAGAVDVELEGINNPTAAGSLYARIVTYDTAANADDYVSDTVVMGSGGALDYGGVAMSITPTIGVSGAVLESMTFCVAKNAITASCANAADPGNAPTVKLGRVVDNITVLDADDVYEDTMYTQLSTNAAGGAVVNLKSNTTGCGGLSRVGAADFAAGCGIAPATGAGGIAQGEAKFGVKTGTAAGVGTSSGELRSFNNEAYYNSTVFKFNYVNANSGVTSPYGDPFLDTNNAPVSNMNMQLTFGASANNTTTAGRYTADLSMIATGKF